LHIGHPARTIRARSRFGYFIVQDGKLTLTVANGKPVEDAKPEARQSKVCRGQAHATTME
jgi:hypothetical protein